MIIYYFNDFDSVGEVEIQQLQPLLPQQQKEALAATKLLSRKREIAISYLMLAYALDHNRAEINSPAFIIKNFPSNSICSVANATNNSQFSILNFQFKEHGKPYLIEHDGIFFNISHCRQAIVTAVSNHEIGVDAEGSRRYTDYLMGRAFNDEEQSSVRNADEKEMEFARIWTRKEAFFKWTGTGILLDHIMSVEQDAASAGCTITTQIVTPEKGEPFFLSIAQ